MYKIMSKIEQEYGMQKITLTNDKIFEAVEYIHDNFTDHNLTIELLSKQFGNEQHVLQKSFRSYIPYVASEIYQSTSLYLCSRIVTVGLLYHCRNSRKMRIQ